MVPFVNGWMATYHLPATASSPTLESVQWAMMSSSAVTYYDVKQCLAGPSATIHLPFNLSRAMPPTCLLES